MKELLEADTDLLLWFNSFHNPLMDQIMMLLTETFIWLPLYAFFIYLIFRAYKKWGWLWIAGAVMTIITCDRVTTGFMKPFFARLRPSQNPDLAGIIHLVDGYKGGLYGFASGHAANTFGIAIFVWLTLRHSYHWIWSAFIWAALMTYTRIYLGVHYPTDILVGASIGLLAGWGWFTLFSKIYQRNFPANTPL